MLDYIKLHVDDAEIADLFNNPLLDFKYETSRTTGEEGRWYRSNYHHCKLSVYKYPGNITQKGRVIFAGSIHKMWNSLNDVLAPNTNDKRKYSGFNGNDFSLIDVLDMLKHVSKLLGCPLQKMIIENIEFGLNLKTSFNHALFINGLLFHRNTAFEFQYGRNSAQAKHQRYIFKIYNKSFQYGMKEGVLRIELKYMKMVDLNKIGFNTAADLNAGCFKNLLTLLISKVKEVMYYDSTMRTSRLKKTERNALDRLSNLLYWMKLPSSQRDRPKKKLNHYIENYSDNLKQKLLDCMEETYVIINHDYELESDVVINHVGTSIKATKNIYIKCRVTGLDISMQKEGSLLLSITGLKYYQTYSPEVFAELRHRYLTPKWFASTNQKQIEEIAHNIRTFRKNRMRQQRSLYKDYQERLFNLPPNSGVAS